MQLYRLMFVLVLGIYLLSPVLMDWWESNQPPWYRPFLLWGGLIIIAALLERSRRHDEF